MSNSFSELFDSEMLDPVTLLLKDDNGAAGKDNGNQFDASKTANVSHNFPFGAYF